MVTDKRNEPAAHGMIRLMWLVRPKAARLRVAEIWRAMGVHDEPGGVALDMEDHARCNSRIICGAVEAGAIPYRERYQARFADRRGFV
jgi:hypothetical protein